MTDEDVREMLAERARAVRPSSDGLAKIEARLAGAPAAARRRLPVPMLAAAAVTIVALVGVAVFVERDDDTVVDTDSPVATAPGAGLPPGVWPWPGDAVEEWELRDPVLTAQAYVSSIMLDATYEMNDNGYEPTDAHSGQVVFSGHVSTTVSVREIDGRWFVESAASDLVTLHEAADGTVTARIEAPGILDHVTTVLGAEPEHDTEEVQPGDEYPGLGDTLDRNDAVIRELFWLDTVGTTGITEIAFGPRTTVPAPAALPPGVWPFPHDDVDEARLDDPVETARAYVDARVGGITDRTTVSAYLEGDNSSGEVVFGGDISTTVFVRRLDGRWHVEGSASDLVTLHDADGDGAFTAVVEAKGWLQSHVVLSSGSSEPLMPAREYDAGEEITEGLAYDLNTDRVVKAVRFLLTSGPEGIKGLSEVAFRPPFAESAIPYGAVWSEGGLDAREVAVAYLADRLGGRAVRVDEPASIDKGRVAEVTWEAGVVRLQYLDGLWYVVEAIGDSIQIKGTSLDVGYVGGTLTLAEAGTVHLSVGDTTWDVRNDVDAEGTDVPFEHEVPTDSPVILRAVFATDTGFVSLAERVIG